MSVESRTGWDRLTYRTMFWGILWNRSRVWNDCWLLHGRQHGRFDYGHNFRILAARLEYMRSRAGLFYERHRSRFTHGSTHTHARL
jgi:hypothetical protein